MSAMKIYLNMFLSKLGVKKITTLLLFIIANILSFSQETEFQWADAFGSGGLDKGNSVTADANGNVYTAGVFYDTVNFDIGMPNASLSSFGSADIFVTKHDPLGNFLWVKQIGGSGFEIMVAMASDLQGNIYLTGSFAGTCDFDPGSAVQNQASNGSFDIFILKLDQDGNFNWVYTNGSSSQEIGDAITVTDAGEVFAAGHFRGTVDFDLSSNTYDLISSVSYTDIFILHLNTNGDFQWVKQLGGTLADYAEDIEIDPSGNIITVGRFSGTADFDPGPGIFNITSNGGTDYFISKLDPNGNFIWAKGIGGIESDAACSVTTDMNGNVYSAGYFRDVVNFGLGGVLTSSGGRDIFIYKLNSNGNPVWLRKIGNSFSESVGGIEIIEGNKILTYGRAKGTVDFNTDAIVQNYNSSTYDVFLHLINLNGGYIGVYNFPSDANCEGNDLTLDYAGNIIGVGNLSGTMDFDLSANTFNLSSNANTDAFVFKLGCVYERILTSPIDDFFIGDQIQIKAANAVTASNFLGQGSIIIYNAGNYIELIEGFEIQSGGSLTTLLDGCN